METGGSQGFKERATLKEDKRGLRFWQYTRYSPRCPYLAQLYSLMDLFPMCALHAQTPLLSQDLLCLLLALTHTQTLPTLDPPVESTSRPPSLTPVYSLNAVLSYALEVSLPF